MTSPVLNSAYYPLWIAHPLLQASLAILIWRRKLLKRYPIFFAYLVSELMLFMVLFASRKNYDYYFYLYWVGTAISVIFGFKVIHEVFTDVLRPFPALRDFSAMLFRWAGAVVLLIAIMAAMGSPRAGFPLIVAGLLSLERSVRVMQCGLVLFLVMFSRYLGISRRHRSFGIALGFGMFAGVELGILALKFSAGAISADTLNLFNMAAYDLAIVIWFAYVILPDPKPAWATGNLLQPQRWEVSLAELTQPVAPESLMPMFDAMVDQAFSKAGAAPKEAKKPPEPVKAAEPDAAESDPSVRHSVIGRALAAAAHRSS